MIAALCSASISICVDSELVGGGGSWRCMLLLHPTLTAEAGSDLCTLRLGLCKLHLQWFPSINQSLTPLGTHGGCQRLHLSVHGGGVFPQPLAEIYIQIFHLRTWQNLSAHSPECLDSLQLALFFLPPNCALTVLALKQLI